MASRNAFTSSSTEVVLAVPVFCVFACAQSNPGASTTKQTFRIHLMKLLSSLLLLFYCPETQFKPRSRVPRPVTCQHAIMPELFKITSRFFLFQRFSQRPEPGLGKIKNVKIGRRSSQVRSHGIFPQTRKPKPGGGT